MPSFVLSEAALRRHFLVSNGRVGKSAAQRFCDAREAGFLLACLGVGSPGWEGRASNTGPVLGPPLMGPKLHMRLLHTLNFVWTSEGRQQDVSQGSLWGSGGPRPLGQPWLGHQPLWQPLSAPEPWFLCLSNVETHRVDGRKQMTLVKAFSQCSANRTFPGLSVT